MDIKLIIKKLLKEKGMGNADAARAFGITPQSMISRMRGKSIRVDTAQEMLNELGYTLMVVPKGTRERENWFTVSDDEVAESCPQSPAQAKPPKTPKPINWIEPEDMEAHVQRLRDKHYWDGE